MVNIGKRKHCEGLNHLEKAKLSRWIVPVNFEKDKPQTPTVCSRVHTKHARKTLAVLSLLKGSLNEIDCCCRCNCCFYCTGVRSVLYTSSMLVFSTSTITSSSAMNVTNRTPTKYESRNKREKIKRNPLGSGKNRKVYGER
ncbi:hypothetical protein KQX54_010001 [Cotesia glomerata]|uniref:Uncharacterized protein n=1 Tax=Cotesia glomerata TaxID=32391 RepID=A0AAV7IRI6_COTGL|nr:hypothetical protein KQX54_010001 [Cotesia glomerata]